MLAIKHQQRLENETPTQNQIKPVRPDDWPMSETLVAFGVAVWSETPPSLVVNDDFQKR